MAALPLLAALPSGLYAAESDAPFPVIGEQLNHPPPEGWKLAWMGGKGDGRYVVEYVPATEDVNSWREGYLAIERIEYPPAEVRKEIEANKAALAEVVLFHYIERAKETCGGRHEEMSQRTNTFNGMLVAVGGGYCDRYGQAAPYGEGSFVGFVEGKDYLFRIQYGWRPKSVQEQENNGRWRIIPQKALQYLEAIKTTSLCGGMGEPACNDQAGHPPGAPTLLLGETDQQIHDQERN